MRSYDIIIIGAGAAGLLLADALGKDPYFRNYSILILEREANKGNDRTWCFWEKGEGHFDHLLSASWDRLYFGGKQFSGSLPIAPYSYKMIRARDFYADYQSRITSFRNISIQHHTVTGFREEDERVIVETPGGPFRCNYIFNSVFSWSDLKLHAKLPVLQQHFIGWFVRTQEAVFEKEVPIFMDFSIEQKGNTRFMYLLPTTEKEALVEYTLFSQNLLQEDEYEAALAEYMKEVLKCENYEVLEREKGRIPMSCHNFAAGNSNHIINIGMAGGWAKPSTGYTFMNTYRNTTALVAHLKSGKPLHRFGQKNRFWWYDLLLLDILARDNSRGRDIFEALFSKRKAPLILKFLDEQTSFLEDCQVIWACPKKDFALALFRRILKGYS